MHYFSALFGKEFYMFRTDLLSILTSLADGNITSMTNTYCCEYSIKTPDDGTVNLCETCSVLYQIKFRNSASRWLLL